MAATLPPKHLPTVAKMAAKHEAKIQTRYGLRKVLRSEGPPKQAGSGSPVRWISLTRDKDAVLVTASPTPLPTPVRADPSASDPARNRAANRARCWCTRSANSPTSGRAVRLRHGDQATKTLMVCAACHDVIHTYLSPTRRRSLESHVLGNGPAWFGGGPHWKGSPLAEATSPCGLSCQRPGPHRVGAALGRGRPRRIGDDDVAFVVSVARMRPKKSAAVQRACASSPGMSAAGTADMAGDRVPAVPVGLA